MDILAEEAGEGTVLDVGCGTGTYAVALARRGFRVVGLDFSPAMLRRAEAKAGDLLGSRITFRLADFNRELPFADQHFEHAVCVCALHCVADPPSFFREVRRVLRPEGRFVLVALSGQRPLGVGGGGRGRSLPRRLFWWAKRRMAKGRRWARYSRAELAPMLEQAGFQAVGGSDERTAPEGAPLVLRAG